MQLGSVQTHVSLNTDALELQKQYERQHLVEIATIQARQGMNERRIGIIEDHDVKTREFEAEIVKDLAAVSARLDVQISKSLGH